MMREPDQRRDMIEGEEATERFTDALRTILALPPDRAAEIRATVRPGSRPAGESDRKPRRRSGAARRPETAARLKRSRSVPNRSLNR